MLVTLLGIVMLVRLVQSLNASFPILVTGKPSIVSGMPRFVGLSRKPVMVIAEPLLLYCRCSTTLELLEEELLELLTKSVATVGRPPHGSVKVVTSLL